MGIPTDFPRAVALPAFVATSAFGGRNLRRRLDAQAWRRESHPTSSKSKMDPR